MSAENFNLTRKFPNSRDFQPQMFVFGRKFSDKFPTAKKVRRDVTTPPPPCHGATALIR